MARTRTKGAGHASAREREATKEPGRKDSDGNEEAGSMTWGRIFRLSIARGNDHGYAAWMADLWEKRKRKGR